MTTPLKCRSVVVAVLFGTLMLTACTEGSKQVTLTTESDSLSYVLGMGYADYLKSVPFDIDIDIVLAGVRDHMADATIISAEDAGKVRNTLSRKVQQEQMAKMAEKNKTEAESYLSKNAARSEVTTTASGLQYEVLTMGEGPKPKATDKVKVHYRGTLLDGKEFDSSYKRGKPTEFVLNQVIKGWTEGVQLMPVGSKFKFTIPSELAYGERGAGRDIGPGATLIFEIELVDIVK